MTHEQSPARRPDAKVTLVSPAVEGAIRLPTSASGLNIPSAKWIATCCAEAQHFGLQSWQEVALQLVKHPEQTSSNILRADILEDSHNEESSSSSSSSSLSSVWLPLAPGFRARRHIKRRLIPRRNNLDATLEQDCYFFDSGDGSDAAVIMTPVLPSGDAKEMPYYHPTVRSLAFCYNGSLARIETHILPFPKDNDFDATLQPQHRLSRTMLALTEKQVSIAWGKENGYRKRVYHDVLIARQDYQELYTQLRDRHASQLLEAWAESTDPRKHVFEDIGIAAFLILLWRDSLPASSDDGQRWARPASFVDLGCGNGLLVYILRAEGYTGYGIDVQERKSWSVYRSLLPDGGDGGVDLRVGAVDAPGICLGTSASSFPPGSFLIGNHADELTSWLPLLAHATPDCPGFLNIPCCRFDLDGTIFSHSKYRVEVDELQHLVGTETALEALAQIELGPYAEAESTSRNISYIRRISHIHLLAGWQLEKEALRIPSTKNWALIGRRSRLWSLPGAVQSKSDFDERVTQLARQEGQNWQARVSCTSKLLQLHH